MTDTLATGRAVDLYRKVVKLETQARITEQLLTRTLQHPDIDMPTYVKLTTEIDEAAAAFEVRIQNSPERLAVSTVRSYLSQALANAGKQ